MRKKKTTNRGRKPAEERQYKDLSEEEKRQYHRNAMRKHRGQSPVATTNTDNETETETPSCSNPTRQSSPIRTRGRPPLMGLVAMTPTTLLGRKRHLTNESRKKQRRSKKSKAAAKLRFSSPESPSGEDVSSDEECQTGASNVSSDEERQTGTSNLPTGALPSTSTITPEALRKAVYRAKCKLRGVFTNDSINNLRLLHLFNQTFLLPVDVACEITKLDSVFSSDRRIYKQGVARLGKIFTPLRPEIQREILKFWFANILQSCVADSLLSMCQVIIPTELQPRSVTVHRSAAELASKYVAASSKLPQDIRINGTKYIIDVARQNNLQSCDASLLASSTNCSTKYARKVLNAITEGKESELLALRAERCDSIHVTGWPSKIAEFVLRPENARATPGNDTVSVSYGVRKPKYILLHSRNKIAGDFKAANPDCKFSISTIKREFPQNAVTATSRDNERNTCPVHANIRRIVTALNNVLRKNSLSMIPSSCRELCTHVMCSSNLVSNEEPISWVETCVLGTCTQCPILDITYPAELGVKEVKFSIWESQKVKVTKTNIKTKKIVTIEKDVFTLYPKTMSLDEAVAKLKSLIPNLKLHIYTAHKQWKAHEILRSNLIPGAIITIEDFQMNLEVTYRQAPTSQAYSSNKVSVAMYPLCVEYLDSDGKLCEGGIVFLSEDKLHDHQQIEAFELKAFEIFKKYIPYDIVSWKRFSDGCGAQFWSKFVIANSFKMKETLNLQSLSYHRFEANEGKSVSDTLGSISKCAFQRGILKKDEGIENLSDIIELIKSELNVSTKKFSFFEVVPFDFIERATSRPGLVIKDISKKHSVTIKDSQVLSYRWTCTECTLSEFCESCQQLKGVDKSAIKMFQTKPKKTNKDGDLDQNDQGENLDENDPDEIQVEKFYDDNDNGQTDDEDDDHDRVESDDDSDEGEVDDFKPGDIVWGLHGRQWYPGVLCSISDVPVNIQHKFKCIGDRFIIYWYGDQLYSLVSKVEKLGITQVDAKRASKSAAMQKLYNQAQADLI